MAKYDLVDFARHVRQRKETVVSRCEGDESPSDVEKKRHESETVAAQQQFARLAVPIGEGEGADQPRQSGIAGALDRIEHEVGITRPACVLLKPKMRGDLAAIIDSGGRCEQRLAAARSWQRSGRLRFAQRDTLREHGMRVALDTDGRPVTTGYCVSDPVLRAAIDRLRVEKYNAGKRTHRFFVIRPTGAQHWLPS